MDRSKHAGLVLFVVLMLLAACGSQGAAEQQVPQPPGGSEEAAPAEEEPTGTADEIVIGIPASLTGQYEALGRQGLDGLQMFADWVNEEHGGIDVGGEKLPVRIVFGDDRSDQDTALRLFEKLVRTDGADFMFASYSSGLTLAQGPLADQLDVVTMAWGASSDDIWQQGFTRIVGVYAPASQYDHSLLDFVTQAEPAAQTISIVYKDDPFTVAEAEGARAKAEELGLEVTYFDKYPATATDLSPILTQAWGPEPDVFLVAAQFQDGALGARQMQELGIDPAASSFGSGSATTEWWDELGEAAQGTFGPAQWEPSLEIDEAAFDESNWVGPQLTPSEWAQQFEERFDYEPDYRAGLSFASGLALMTAIEEAGSTESDAVTEAIKGLDIQSMGGGFKVDPETLIQVGHDMLTIQWQDGEKVIIAPEEAANGSAIYPANE